jgi:hypothetical protein
MKRTPNAPPEVTRHERRAIAYMAKVSDRSVENYLRGTLKRATTRAAIRECLVDSGYQHVVEAIEARG